MISIGLLGCGRIGQVHAGSIARMENATLTAVADAMPEAAEVLARRAGATVRAAEDIIAADDIDAVIIATPTTLHYDQIHALAQAGKAIFCEKPIDLSAERAGQCLKAVHDAGVPFMTAFNRRFDPGLQKMSTMVQRGDIGEIQILKVTNRDPKAPPILLTGFNPFI